MLPDTERPAPEPTGAALPTARATKSAKLVKQFGKVPDVDANESRLGQVFLNLIINAAHAIPPGKYDTNQILVSTTVDDTGRNVVVAIRDTGSGMPPVRASMLFSVSCNRSRVHVTTASGSNAPAPSR